MVVMAKIILKEVVSCKSQMYCGASRQKNTDLVWVEELPGDSIFFTAMINDGREFFC